MLGKSWCHSKAANDTGLWRSVLFSIFFLWLKTLLSVLTQIQVSFIHPLIYQLCHLNCLKMGNARLPRFLECISFDSVGQWWIADCSHLVLLIKLVFILEFWKKWTLKIVTHARWWIYFWNTVLTKYWCTRHTGWMSTDSYVRGYDLTSFAMLTHHLQAVRDSVTVEVVGRPPSHLCHIYTGRRANKTSLVIVSIFSCWCTDDCFVPAGSLSDLLVQFVLLGQFS